MNGLLKKKWVWNLRRGLDRRFRSGHPWVYSNELVQSPQGIEPGDLVELQDTSGKFLATGYGNPHSLIAFRVLSRNAAEQNPFSVESVTHRLQQASELRMRLGFQNVSYRLCFGEADDLPGLVIDRYLLDAGQVISVQAHTAGAQRICHQITDIVQAWVELQQAGDPHAITWENTAIILRNDLSIRKLEGLSEEEPHLLKPMIQSMPDLDCSQAFITVPAALTSEPLRFQVNLLKGQKTGFFLDQQANIQLAAQRFQHSGKKEIRILDLCCYVGQWGVQLAKIFQRSGMSVHVVAVDASQEALQFARSNLESQGISCEILKANVLKELSSFESQSFDFVISDPPSLVQHRRDQAVGAHAYLQLATQVFRLVKKGGGVVCCSCSTLLDEESFTQVLSKAARRNQVSVQWVARGMQSPDHPMRVEFPEGRYLKAWIGFVV